MRCKNCEYCRYDRADDMYECSLYIDNTENSKGECGCRYNRKTLLKLEENYWKKEKEWAEKLLEWGKERSDV